MLEPRRALSSMSEIMAAACSPVPLLRSDSAPIKMDQGHYSDRELRRRQGANAFKSLRSQQLFQVFFAQ